MMILSDSEMQQIVQQLVRRTLDERLPWYREDDCLVTTLPNSTTVQLSDESDAPDYVVRIKGPGGNVFGQVTAPKQAGSLMSLYDAASKTARKSLFTEIMASLEEVDADESTTTLPPRITPTAAARVLELMTGNWALDFSRGTERVRIDGEGNYYANDQRVPRFRLRVLAWNEATSTTEVAKDTPDGRRLQIERLAIAKDTMTGHAKHDGHRLEYVRAAK